MEYIFEAKINTEDRNKLPDSAFGIPSKRKYPLTDEKHVLQAVRFFNKADEEDKSELAHNIVKRAKELNMDWEKWDVLKPYLDKPIKEAYDKELHSTPEADELYTYLSKSVEYDNASPETWRLKSPDELTDHNKGNCHDTAWYVFKNLDAYANHPVGKGILFFIEYKEGKNEGGQTHSVCYEKIPGGICIIECSWQGMAGTFPYNNINEYVSVVKNNWEFTGDNDKLYATEIKNASQIHPGMTLGEYVSVAMKNKEIITESYVPHPDDDYTSGTSDFNHDDDDPDDCYCESDKERVNDKGEIVPDKCTKCDSPIEIYLKGEPVYLCSNKKCGKYYGTVPCNINESHQMSETEAFYKRWKEKEGSSVLKQAKDIVKKIAKKVEEDEQPPCGNQNCKLCTWCVEAQFRGIDVLPRPLYSPRDPALDIIGETIVKDPVRISIQNGYDGMLEHLMEPTANVARFYCHVNWNNSTGGHEFIILKIGEQNFFIVDAQAGIVEPLSDSGNYFNDINYANSFICRLDNRDFNKELFEKYNDPKSIVPWDGRLDIPYMLENGMLSEKEAEQYWQEHPDERPVQESKMILNSNDSRIPKLMCEGWKIAGTTINNEYILIQEGYDDISLHVSLVPATMNDVPNMEAWEYECMKDAYPNREIPESEVDKLKAELHQDAIDSVHKTRMIQYDGQTIGMLTAYKVLDDQYWYIAEIYLVESFRGKGIAKYILQQEIDQHDKLILNVYKSNTHAIELYKSLGFEIVQNDENRYIMELDKTKQSVQEGYWQDIKNGVNPKSKKVWFHVSFDDKLDEKGPMIPRIPTWLEEVKKDGYTTSDGKKTHDLDEVMKDTGRYENYTTPRVCFSPSIEGALNSIINMWKLKNKDFPGKQLYVYIPEKPISQYKHKTNKELVRDKEVFDAGTTGESWILEPVKVKFYGSIKIDKVKDNGRKHKVLIRPGFEKETDNPMDNYIGRFTYKWHWLIHPSILKQGEKYEKSEKKAQSPLEVCNDIVAELKDYKYGFVKDGKLITDASDDAYGKYYKFMTLDEFEKYQGGICYDYVEWEESYLKDHGKSYKKYYLYADSENTHTFILVKSNDELLWVETAFKDVVGVHKVHDLQEACKLIVTAMFRLNNSKRDEINYYVWEYKGHPEYGSSLKQCTEYYTKGEFLTEGTVTNPKKSK
jgi:ribosomal protein S18 acetylase RimI-like enzyme